MSNQPRRYAPLASAGVLSCALVALLGTTPACVTPEAAVSDQARDSRPSRGDFERALLLTGELKAVQSTAIKAPQTAQFQMRIQFMAEEGSTVGSGDPLLTFDSSALSAQVRDLEVRILDAETQIVAKRSELASALKDLEIELATAQYEHDRTQLLAGVDQDVLPAKEHAERQLAFSKAKRALDETVDRVQLTRKRGTAEVDVLEINRDKLEKDLLKRERDRDLMTITAPASGLVVYERREGTDLRYQEGDSCWPGQGIMRLPDLTEMEVEFSVSEIDAPLLAVDMPVMLELDAFPGRHLEGRIDFIPSMAVKISDDSKLNVFKVVASIAETWVGEMKPGMSVRGRIVVERHEGVPLLPRDLVEHDADGYWIRADATRDGQRLSITPVARDARSYVISEEDYEALTDRLAAGHRGDLS